MKGEHCRTKKREGRAQNATHNGGKEKDLDPCYVRCIEMKKGSKGGRRVSLERGQTEQRQHHLQGENRDNRGRRQYRVKPNASQVQDVPTPTGRRSSHPKRSKSKGREDMESIWKIYVIKGTNLAKGEFGWKQAGTHQNQGVPSPRQKHKTLGP